MNNKIFCYIKVFAILLGLSLLHHRTRVLGKIHMTRNTWVPGAYKEEMEAWEAIENFLSRLKKQEQRVLIQCMEWNLTTSQRVISESGIHYPTLFAVLNRSAMTIRTLVRPSIPVNVCVLLGYPHIPSFVLYIL